MKAGRSIVQIKLYTHNVQNIASFTQINKKSPGDLIAENKNINSLPTKGKNLSAVHNALRIFTKNLPIAVNARTTFRMKENIILILFIYFFQLEISCLMIILSCFFGTLTLGYQIRIFQVRHCKKTKSSLKKSKEFAQKIKRVRTFKNIRLTVDN
tara:strand:- start:9706 stop:10170 length:465 start_codon:yes stop_codon:yes gene_type:complete